MISKAPELIEIDGRFDDWKGVSGYEDEDDYFLPENINIVGYRVKDIGPGIYFYLEVKGEILKGDNDGQLDSIHIFIDVDLDADTGFVICGIGADYMIQIHGRRGRKISSSLMEFTSDTQYNWSGFQRTEIAVCKASSSGLEARIKYSQVGMQRGDLLEVLFQTQDNKGNEDISDTTATTTGGVLVINQDSMIGQDVLVPSTSQPVLELNIKSLNNEIILQSITVMKSSFTAAAPLQMSGRFTGSASFNGNTATFQINRIIDTDANLIISADTTGIHGKAMGFKIASKDDVVVDSGCVFLTTKKVRNAYIGSPDAIVIDGAFGDWNKASAPHDETDDVENHNIDIANYYMADDNESNMFYFYLSVNGEMMKGTHVPFINEKRYQETAPPKEPDSDRDTVGDSIDIRPNDFDNDGVDDVNEEGDVDSDGILDYPAGKDMWLNTTLPLSFPSPFKGKIVTIYIGPAPALPDVFSLDTTFVFMDTDDDSTTGYSVGNIALGADYLLQIAGKDGRIVTREAKKFSGLTPLSWKWTDVNADLYAEIDSTQMEMGVNYDNMGVERGVKVFLKTTDWKSRKDGSNNVLERRFNGTHMQVTTGAFVGARFDPFVVRNQGDVHQSPDAASWTYEGNPTECFRWVGMASGSGNTAGYVYVLRSDGKVYFTDRGTNGWYEYGYGAPAISDNTSYVDITAGSGSNSGYVFVLRNDGKVFFIDRGVNGWNEYGYGSPEIGASTAYVSITSGSGTTAGYVYVLRNDGKVFFADRGVNGWYEYGYGSPKIETSNAYASIAAGSGPSTGYVYVLRNDGKVFFADRGVNGWYEYGYGSPEIGASTAYVSIASGSGTTVGYVYVLRNDGKVFFVDRGVNGWYEYGYGAPSIADSTTYVDICSGDRGGTSGYAYVLRGDGRVYFTDRGVNGWHGYGYGTPTLPAGVWHVGISAFSEEMVFVLLSNGSVYKSLDGGSTWAFFGDAGSDDDWIDIFVTFSGYVYVLNNEGEVQRSPMGTASWSAWGDAGSGTSWVSITADSGGYLYALRNDGTVVYATDSDSNWLSKGDAGEHTSWVAIAAWDGGGGSYVYAMRNNRSINRAPVGTSSSWSGYVTEGEDTSWVSLAVDSVYIYTLRNDGRIDRADIGSGTWAADFGDVGGGSSYVDISTVVSEFRTIAIPLLIMLFIYNMRKQKNESEEK